MILSLAELDLDNHREGAVFFEQELAGEPTRNRKP